MGRKKCRGVILSRSLVILSYCCTRQLHASWEYTQFELAANPSFPFIILQKWTASHQWVRATCSLRTHPPLRPPHNYKWTAKWRMGLRERGKDSGGPAFVTRCVPSYAVPDNNSESISLIWCDAFSKELRITFSACPDLASETYSAEKISVEMSMFFFSS